MIQENFNIVIVGKQDYGFDTGEISIDTTGSYTKRGDTHFISYSEFDEEHPNKPRTSVLEIEKNKMIMMHESNSTRLILEKGKRHLCMYDTGMGMLTIGVFTSEFSANLNDSGGALRVKYTLDVDSSLSSRNELSIDVKRIT